MLERGSVRQHKPNESASHSSGPGTGSNPGQPGEESRQHGRVGRCRWQLRRVRQQSGRGALHEGGHGCVDAILFATLAADVQALEATAASLGQATGTAADLTTLHALKSRRRGGRRTNALLVVGAKQMPLALHPITACRIQQARATASLPLPRALWK